MVSTEAEQLQAVRPCLERACRGRRDAKAIERSDVEKLAVELRAPAPAHDDVDLLGVGMTVGERAALAGLQAKVRDACALSAERLARDPRLPAVAEPVRRSGVFDVGQVDLGEGLRHTA